MGDSIVRSSRDDLSAMNFYKDSVVLITGGTGFIGKVLIEKILRCFEVKKIYLLLREKRNVKAKDRLKEIFQEPIFNVIRSNHSNPASVFSKVNVIDTNFQNDQIISAHDRELLLSEVTVVFNVMASVKFNENIESALDTNVVCSRKLFDIVCQMLRVRSIVHVSTFYSNCDRSRIEEQVFDDIPFGGYSNLLSILSHLKESEKEQLTPMILGTMPNSYTFSKKCAEAMIQQQYAHLPISIFRPPVVTSAYQEPIPGWVDNFNGISGMCLPMIQGKFYCCMAERKIPSHTVPVDYCVAAMLAVGAENARTDNVATDKRVPVYNYATDANNIRWGDFGKWISQGCDTRLGRLFGRFAIVVTSSRFLRQMFVWWFVLQAVAADLLLVVVGKKRQNLLTLNRVFALEDAARYFAMHGWTVENDNMRRVLNRMSDEERALLPFDIDQLDWEDYFRNFLPGIKAALARCYQRRQSRKAA
ncbi:fatty acyl-CoA reductase wat-like [Ochlerotatus camptorhynchus]|uniref:fatty acyl-CoA reductase wat-like n=1 Tax=Ochlerotatus camptorhynchus TaxID=644619 RepID=UPI0031D7C089